MTANVKYIPNLEPALNYQPKQQKQFFVISVNLFVKVKRQVGDILPKHLFEIINTLGK